MPTKDKLTKDFLAPTSATSGLAGYNLEQGVKQTHPAMLAGKLKAKKPKKLTSLITLIEKAAPPGHEFYGNQWTKDGTADPAVFMGNKADAGSMLEMLEVKEMGEGLDWFRTTPAYKRAVEQGLIHDDEWVADSIATSYPIKKWDYAVEDDCPHCGKVLRKAVLNPKLGRTRAWVLANEKPLQEELGKTLRSVGEQVSSLIAARLGKADLTRLLRKSDSVERRVEEVLDSLDLSGLSKAVIKQLKAALRDAFKAGVEDGVTAVAVAIDKTHIDVANEKAVDYADSRSADLVGMKLIDGKWVENPNPVYSISEATREGLRGLTRTAVEEGMGAAELKQAILDSYFFSTKRAETIARTELAFAHVQGNVAIWKEWGNVGGKESILADTHPAPDECDENADAGVIPLDDIFPSGDLAPPFHPNCLCGLTPYLHEEMPKQD